MDVLRHPQFHPGFNIPMDELVKVPPPNMYPRPEVPNFAHLPRHLWPTPLTSQFDPVNAYLNVPYLPDFAHHLLSTPQTFQFTPVNAYLNASLPYPSPYLPALEGYSYVQRQPYPGIEHFPAANNFRNPHLFKPNSETSFKEFEQINRNITSQKRGLTNEDILHNAAKRRCLGTLESGRWPKEVDGYLNRFEAEDTKSKNINKPFGGFEQTQNVWPNNNKINASIGSSDLDTISTFHHKRESLLGKHPLGMLGTVSHQNKPISDNKSMEVGAEDKTLLTECEDEDREEDELKCDNSRHNMQHPLTFHLEYTFHPPPTEVLAEYFVGLVIFYYYRVKNIPEMDPFYVICQSFAQSDKFSYLEVKEGKKFVKGFKIQQFCTLSYKGMMLAKAAGDTLTEARVRAGAELVNKLAMFCCTLQMKAEYYTVSGLQMILEQRELPGVFRVVPREKYPCLSDIYTYIQSFCKEDSDCELVFGGEGFEGEELRAIKSFARGQKLDIRQVNGYVIAFKKRTPQYWRDKILLSGTMENEKFILFSPMGFGKELLKDLDFPEFIPGLKKDFQLKGPTSSLQYLFGAAAPLIESGEHNLEIWRRFSSQNTKEADDSKWTNILMTIQLALKTGKHYTTIPEFKILPRWVKEKFISQMIKIKLL